MNLIADAEAVVKQSEAIGGIAPIVHMGSHYEDYMNLTEDDMSGMSKEDFIQANYVLNQYAASVNKHIGWLESKLEINQRIFDRELVKVYSSYNEFMGRDLIIASAVNEYTYLREMQEEILKLTAAVRSTEGLITRIDNMAKCMTNLAFTRNK
jgi:hypothetical protein